MFGLDGDVCMGWSIAGDKKDDRRVVLQCGGLV
jgi:hypothetical protein